MSTQPRVPQAPTDPLPDLAAFLARFALHFAQRKSAATLERYLTGLLTEHPQKNCQRLAEVVLGTNDQRLNHLLTEMRWDETDLNRQRVAVMLELPTEGDAALLFDERRICQTGLGFGRRGPPVFGHFGQSRQLSGLCQLRLCRAHAVLACGE